MSVRPVLPALSVWTHVRIICTVSIVRNGVAVRTEPNVMREQATAIVQTVGRAPIALNVCVRKICLEKIAIVRANAKRTIRQCVIRGRANVIVNPDGVVACAIDRVHF